MTTTTTDTGQPLDQYMAGQVSNPQLPTGTTFIPELQPTDPAVLQAQGTIMNGTGATMPNQAPVANTPTVVAPVTQAVTGQASTIDPNAPGANINPQAGQYTASTIGNNVPQGTAAQGTVNPNATVQGQLANLYSQTANGQTPAWAQGAVNAANEAMAARGLGASTIGTTALALAVQQSALPIAAQDASTYFQMDMTNLSNEQQMAMENLKNKQQALLSDQAATNAASQFNASSASQTQQFMATLVSNIMTQNADRTQAMSQFNVGQENQIASQNTANSITTQSFNAQQQAAVNQFNSQQQFARDQFNAQAAFAIEQSNVLWRRNINTANTAAINAANQTNVQNAFDMSQNAQNALWQQWRDSASWAFTASENEKTRQFNAAMQANNQVYNREGSKFNWATAAGSFAQGLIKV